MSTDDNTLPERPSKSQRKRDMIDVQKIGEALVNLGQNDLDKISLPETLADAIAIARTLGNNEGRRRQLQYIGRLMRDIEIAPIQEAIEKVQSKHQHNNAQFHQVEQLRDKLIAQGDPALQALLTEHPEADHQRLRQLIRNAQKDLTTGKNSGAHLELFRYLREIKR